MMNTFSLILIIITGISGVFWGIKRFYVFIGNYGWYRIRYIKGLKEIYDQRLKNICQLKIISYFVYIFELIASIFPILFLVFIVRSFILEPFQIPSGSMMPNLLSGDFILVKKFVYGIKNPINQKTLVNVGHPKRGDVIVFKYPKDPALYYIKRVVGEPEDKIIYNIITKQLVIYPHSLDNSRIYNTQSSLPITYNNIVPSDFVQEFHTSENGTVSITFVKTKLNDNSCHGIRLIQTTESLGNATHNILTMIPPGDPNFVKMYDQHTKHLISEWYVPKGEYFVMGDNRDNSSDSRYWGCVPERNVVGKAVVIWMSLQKQEGQWPTGIQLSRIGTIK